MHPTNASVAAPGDWGQGCPFSAERAWGGGEMEKAEMGCLWEGGSSSPGARARRSGAVPGRAAAIGGLLQARAAVTPPRGGM